MARSAALIATLAWLAFAAAADGAEIDNAAAMAAELRAAEKAARADAQATGLDEALAAYYAGSLSEALDKLGKLAENGAVEAMHWLGVIYDTGEKLPADFAVAALWYEQAVDNGDYAPAQYRLAVLYEYGRGVVQDTEAAVELYEAAAEQGHVDAQRNLAFAYERGWGVEKDPVKAFRWYQRAADQGDADAYEAARRLASQPLPDDFELDEIEEAMAAYYRGDAFRAVSGFTALAEDEDPAGMSWLGYMSEAGFGTPKNLARAAGLYGAAARYDDVKALLGLGTMYYYGAPMAEDRAVAAALFREAAEQGSLVARFNLAYMYEQGTGVPADGTLAIRWFRSAAVLGYDEAAVELKRLGQ